MQMTSRFTTAVHVLACIEIFGGEMRVTSEFLSGSTGVNAVIIRNVLAKLKAAGIVNTKQGSGGASLVKPLSEVTLYDIYKAVECVDDRGLFHFHENPNVQCPVGRNIHKAMDGRLDKIQETMENELKKVTLAEVIDDTKNIIQSEK